MMSEKNIFTQFLKNLTNHQGNKPGKFLDKYIGDVLCYFLSFFCKTPNDNQIFEPKKILVIKFGAIGDTALMLPFLKCLKENFHSSHIAVIAWKKNKFLLENFEYIDEIIYLGSVNSLFNPLKLLRIIQLFRGKSFDSVIDLVQFGNISQILPFLSGIKLRIGFKIQGRAKNKLLTKKIEYHFDKHELDCFLDIILGIGGNRCSVIPSLGITFTNKLESIQQRFLIEHDLRVGELLIGVHIGAKWPEKRWEVEKYGELIDTIASKYRAKILVYSGPEEEDLFHTIRKLIHTRLVKYFHGYSLEEALASTKFIKLLITNDNGFMHLAEAMGVPILAIFGPSDYRKWGPYGRKNVIISKNFPCSPCNILGSMPKCKNGLKCMKEISVEEVLLGMEKLLKSIND